jgi:hypothetical protein
MTQFARNSFNDAFAPQDAPAFTDEYIRLGMPGWPCAANAITDQAEADRINLQSASAGDLRSHSGDPPGVAPYLESSDSGLPVARSRSAHRSQSIERQRSETATLRVARSRGQTPILGKNHTLAAPLISPRRGLRPIEDSPKLIRRKPLKHGRYLGLRSFAMTTCVAAICGGGKAIILVADKMLGFGHVEAAIGDKILPLHTNWHVLYAGNDISPTFPIVDRASAILQANQKPTLLEVASTLTAAWKAERDSRTEAKVFAGRVGWTLERFFNEGKDHFSSSEVMRLTGDIETEELDVELIIAGFDERNRPFILSMDSLGHSIPQHRPGCWTIGSGSSNALTFLGWREVKPSMPIRGALAYAVEAKYYGELASGVSAETDVIIMQPNEPDIVLKDVDVEDILFKKIAIENEPRKLTHRQCDLLNGIKDLANIPYVWLEKDDRLIETEKRRKLPRSRKSSSDNIIELTQQSPQSPKADA